ncbi:MAG: GTPase Era [Dissulfurimicrobium hydrothermale]|uniref:GTPase Era n=1 Tax=Dissulfurimicrobium hydrothermale TaxID=1750598 RepID=UPI003C71A19F
MRSELDEKGPFRSGFVAIIGAPNAGKSTLLNQLLGEKVAIVTPKPQTTRRNIKGVLTGRDYQIIFIDTPGIHRPKRPLNKLIVKSAIDAMRDADLLLMLADISCKKGVEAALSLVDVIRENSRCDTILAFNKIDMVKRETLLPLIDLFKDAYPFRAIVPVSARCNNGMGRLVSEILRSLPAGPQYYYDGSCIVDQGMDEFAAELVREKIFLTTREEVPYSVAVEAEKFDKGRDGLIRIKVVVYVERQSQKGIIIGKEGVGLKRIGTLARVEMEKRWGCKVYLDIWVKTLKDWSRDKRHLRRFGFGD